MMTSKYIAQARAASGVNVVLGVCLAASPWVFGYHVAGPAATWNSVIVGALIAILAASRVYLPRVHPGVSWINFCLGLWTIMSPWLCEYAGNMHGRWDNVALGIVIAALAIWSASASVTEIEHHPPAAPAH